MATASFRTGVDACAKRSKQSKQGQGGRRMGTCTTCHSGIWAWGGSPPCMPLVVGHGVTRPTRTEAAQAAHMAGAWPPVRAFRSCPEYVAHPLLRRTLGVQPSPLVWLAHRNPAGRPVTVCQACSITASVS
eukprot:350190-Chlamydomonas_euryale.AAC.6